MSDVPMVTGGIGSEGGGSEQLRMLTEISRALTYTVEIDDVLRLATERAAGLLAADRALLMLADGDGLLQLRSAHGVDPDALREFREPLDETLLRRLKGILDASTPESFLGVPLVAHGRVTGLLAVVRPEGHPCTEEEEWLLSAVADQVAVALENARLQEEMRAERERASRDPEDPPGGVDEAGERALATLSHDLRSPLNAIDSYAELMEMEILGPVSDRQREALGRIRMSGRHLLAVLENVLEMTRLSAGVVRVRAEAVAAALVTEEAVLIVRPMATARRQTIALELSDEVHVIADQDRLRQVLVNLIGNAVKYTPPGGRITVAVTRGRADGRTRGFISVTDTGAGIAPDQLGSIFQPYYRVPNASSDGPEGAGLGLAISRELIRQMGGDVAVESELGRGSVFTIRLELSGDESETEKRHDDQSERT